MDGSWFQTTSRRQRGIQRRIDESPLLLRPPPLPLPPPLQAYLNVELVKGVTRPITADDANKASEGDACCNVAAAAAACLGHGHGPAAPDAPTAWRCQLGQLALAHTGICSHWQRL